jgi:predicted nucleic acid-binding protein
MAAGKVLVLDANILIRAVLGIRARSLLLKYSMTAQFLVPDAAMKEAEEHLPAILSKRRIPMDASQAVLDSLTGIVQVAPSEAYSAFEEAAKRRLARRDIDDWPILATAMAFGCSIWTEDADFFGAGIATWTTDRVEIFLSSETPEE